MNDNEVEPLVLFTSFLSVLNYSENLKQTSNDDLMSELKDVHEFKMQTIIDQNNEIINLLKKLNNIINHTEV